MLLPLNNEEAQVLLNFVDIALKSIGLQGAQAALLFQQKIQMAQKAEADELAKAAPPAPPVAKAVKKALKASGEAKPPAE